MNSSYHRRLAVVYRTPLAVAADCTPTPTAPPLPTASATGAATSTAAAAAEDAVGASCTQPGEQGECAAGLVCFPGPGGYCSAFCGWGATCPGEGACTPTVKAGEVCLDPCASDADCRTAEHYTCDRAWKVCMLPGFIGPKAPVCEGPPPRPRARFSEPRLISTGKTSKYGFEPAATLMPNGDVVVVYTAMNGMVEDNGLESVVVHPDGAAEAPRPFKSDRKRHFDPWLTTWNDEAVLVWLGHDGGFPDQHMQVGLARSKDGASWSAPVDVLDRASDCPDDRPGCSDKPMVATAGPKSESLVVFYYSDPTEGMRARTSLDGKTFGPSVPVLGDAYGDVFVDARGGVHVVAPLGTEEGDRFGDPGSVLELASSSDGGKTFGKPENVSAAGEPLPFYFSNAQVAVDLDRKRRYVAYPTGSADGRWDIVLAWQELGAGKGAGREKVNDDAPCANHMKPTMALDPKTGKLHLVWTENRGHVGRLVYATCAVDGGAMACGPNEIVADAFASYSFVRHAAGWLGEYDALVVDDKRRTLHAIFAATIDEGGVPTARVFHALARLD